MSACKCLPSLKSKSTKSRILIKSMYHGSYSSKSSYRSKGSKGSKKSRGSTKSKGSVKSRGRARLGRRSRSRSTSRSKIAKRLGRRSMSVQGGDNPLTFDGPKKRYMSLGATKTVSIPYECVTKLNRIGKLSGQLCRELGGTVCLLSFAIKLEAGGPGTDTETFIPSQASLARRNVLRFHCHPLTTFQTPPSYHDLIQTCKDYVQRNDGVAQHLVITPAAFFIMSIPPKILFQLELFIAPRVRLSGVKRKDEFVRSELFDAIVAFCEKIKTYQKCHPSYNEACVQKFIAAMKNDFDFPIDYRKFTGRSIRLPIKVRSTGKAKPPSSRARHTTMGSNIKKKK